MSLNYYFIYIIDPSLIENKAFSEKICKSMNIEAINKKMDL